MGAEPAASGGVRQYCVLSPGRAGDFILTTGLFNALKAYDPSCRLTIVVGPRAAGMARLHPSIDRVLVFDRHPFRLIPFVFRLRDRVFDAWLDPKDHHSTNQALLARLARARVKVGFNRPAGGPFTVPLKAPTGTHEHFSVEMLKPLDLIGIPAPRPPRLSLGLPDSSVSRARSILGTTKQFTVVVNLSAGRPLRYWEEGKWGSALPQMARVRPVRFLLSAAPEDGDLADRVTSEARRLGVDITRLPPGSMLDLAAVVAEADAVVTVDTSIVHVAALTDRPIVALYHGDQHAYSMFYPLSTRREVIMSDPGQPVAVLDVDDVVDAYRRLVSGL